MLVAGEIILRQGKPPLQNSYLMEGSCPQLPCISYSLIHHINLLDFALWFKSIYSTLYQCLFANYSTSLPGCMSVTVIQHDKTTNIIKSDESNHRTPKNFSHKNKIIEKNTVYDQS